PSHIRYDRALTICSYNMNTCNFLFWITEFFEHPNHAFYAWFDAEFTSIMNPVKCFIIIHITYLLTRSVSNSRLHIVLNMKLVFLFLDLQFFPVHFERIFHCLAYL